MFFTLKMSSQHPVAPAGMTAKETRSNCRIFKDKTAAALDSWFSHLAVEVQGTETSNEWLEAVSDEEYGKLK